MFENTSAFWTSEIFKSRLQKKKILNLKEIVPDDTSRGPLKFFTLKYWTREILRTK